MLDVCLVFERNRAVVIQTVNAVFLVHAWVLDQQTNKSVCLQDLFELCAAAILGLLEKSGENIVCTVLVVTGLKHNFSECQLKYRYMALTHISLCFEFRDFELHLVHLVTDVNTH